VNSHMPTLAIPPSAPPLQPTLSQRLGHDTSRPRVSFDSSSSVVSNSSSTGIENVGGAIEGWFRKVASRTMTSLNELQQPSQLYNHLGIGGNGDLIELDDTRESSSRTATPSRSPVRPTRVGNSSGISDGRDSSMRGRAGRPAVESGRSGRSKDD
jgi:hypothetical protein